VKPAGLAGAGLRAGHQVASGKDDGDGLGLDRGGCFVSLLVYGAKDLGYETQFSEFQA